MQAKASILNNTSHHLEQDDDVAIRAINLGKCYHIYDKPQDRLKQAFLWGRKKLFRDFWALRDVSFEVKKGETLGIIGRNGSGKSTLLQLVCGTIAPTTGDVVLNGRVAAILELGTGFNFEFTGRENVYMNASILGLSKDEIDSRYEEIVSFADIGDFVDQPVKTYSSGMVIRLAFAVAISVNPEILIVDEALAVGDVMFRRKCYSEIEKMREAGTTILFVSHDMNSLAYLCDRAFLLDCGRILESGEVKKIIKLYYKKMIGEQEKQMQKHDLPEKTSKDDGTYFDENWMSELPSEEIRCQEELRYGNKKVLIKNFGIFDENGKRVEILISGKTYAFSLRVFFNENISEDIFIGSRISDQRGMEICGDGTRNHQIILKDQKKGEMIEVKFYFTVWIAPGEYFCTFGLMNIYNEFFDRRVDCLQFNVISPERTIHGLVNMDTRIEIEKISCI